jgi:sigma54-dependent transcription regulator
MPKPLLLQSDLTGQYYIATRYTLKTLPNGMPYFSCSMKYDATAEVQTYIDKATEPLRQEIERLREAWVEERAYHIYDSFSNPDADHWIDLSDEMQEEYRVKARSDVSIALSPDKDGDGN